MNRVLLLGPRYQKSGKVGGIVISFEMLLSELDRFNVCYTVIDTNKGNYSNRLAAFVSIVMKAIWQIPRVSHVSLHGTANDYKYIAPFVVGWANLFGKHVSLRKFAGSFKEVFLNGSPVSKALIRYSISNATVNFYQTKGLVSYFSPLNPNTVWLSTARPRPQIKRVERGFNKRFIFLGHVRHEKGIFQLIEAADRLPEGYQVDIYGEVIEPDLEKAIASSKAMYKGILRPDDVARTLSEYDVLVLPTFWKGEGYPGVIIEAFSVGIPVISTNLEGISEIVFHGTNGLLVNPRSVDELTEVILYFNDDNYCEYCKNASLSFEQFESSSITRKFLEYIDVRFS